MNLYSCLSIFLSLSLVYISKLSPFVHPYFFVNSLYLWSTRSQIRGKLFLSYQWYCNSVWNLNLANNFWTVNARNWYITWVFLVTRLFRGYQHIWSYDLDFEFALINFWTASTIYSARIFILHIRLIDHKSNSTLQVLCYNNYPNYRIFVEIRRVRESYDIDTTLFRHDVNICNVRIKSMSRNLKKKAENGISLKEKLRLL